MNWKRMLASISGSADQELLLRNEYLATENRILRNQIPGRLQLTAMTQTGLPWPGSANGLEEMHSKKSPNWFVQKPSWRGISLLTIRIPPTVGGFVTAPVSPLLFSALNGPFHVLTDLFISALLDP
jgi:hypothetical protein